jgi:hypothetical protein
MIWRKIQNLSFVKQGALNGFILGSLIQVLFVTFFIYEELTNYLKNKFFPLQESFEGHISTARMIDDTALWIISPVLCLIVALSCFVVQCILFKRIKSSIILWQIVGLVTFVFFFLYGGIHNYIEVYLRQCYATNYEGCQSVSLISQLQPHGSDLPSLSVAFGIFLIFNLLFTFALRRFKPAFP